MSNFWKVRIFYIRIQTEFRHTPRCRSIIKIKARIKNNVQNLNAGLAFIETFAAVLKMACANQPENAAKRRKSYDLKYKLDAVQCAKN